MAAAGVSTLGIEVFQALSTDGNKVTDGSMYTQLTRINAIGGVDVTPETIDASALEDYISKSIAGRSSVSDSMAITVNATDDTIAQWKAILNKKICLMVTVPDLTEAFFTILTVPSVIPQPSLDQNGLLTFDMNCTVNDFIGLDEAVEVTTGV